MGVALGGAAESAFLTPVLSATCNWGSRVCKPNANDVSHGSSDVYDAYQLTPNSSPTNSTRDTPVDPDLIKVIKAWPKVSIAIRRAIIELISVVGW